MRLLLASVAASAGSRTAALLLLEVMKDTDYGVVPNVHDALKQAVYRCGDDPPEWLLGMVEAALSDERYATALEKTNWSSDTVFTLCYLADEYGGLALALGHVKCRKAVPFLIERAKKTNGSRDYVMALGWIGDPQAVPVLIELLKSHGKGNVYREGFGLTDVFSRPVYALADLKAVEAVPALLEHVEFPEVIEALERIGDRRAVPALTELVRTEGKSAGAGQLPHPELARGRLVAARIALACVEEGDVLPRLLALLRDKDFGEFDRRAVVWRLGDRADPKAIPALIETIKTDPSGAVVNQSITVLAVFKYKSAVEGLIECFDADFDRKEDWKRACTPGMFRENIAGSLRDITGKNFGADKESWLDWWQAEGKASPGLK